MFLYLKLYNIYLIVLLKGEDSIFDNEYEVLDNESMLNTC